MGLLLRGGKAGAGMLENGVADEKKTIFRMEEAGSSE